MLIKLISADKEIENLFRNAIALSEQEIEFDVYDSWDLPLIENKAEIYIWDIRNINILNTFNQKHFDRLHLVINDSPRIPKLKNHINGIFIDYIINHEIIMSEINMRIQDVKRIKDLESKMYIDNETGLYKFNFIKQMLAKEWNRTARNLEDLTYMNIAFYHKREKWRKLNIKDTMIIAAKINEILNRSGDWIGHTQDGLFNLVLTKTNVISAHSLINKLNENLDGFIYGFHAGCCSVEQPCANKENMPHTMEIITIKALEHAMEKNELLISEDFAIKATDH